MDIIKRIKLRDFEIGGDRLTILAGPCVIESQELLYETAEGLKKITEELGINFVFKSSFDKANRSSITSFRGPGITKGLKPFLEMILFPEKAEAEIKLVNSKIVNDNL